VSLSVEEFCLRRVIFGCVCRIVVVVGEGWRKEEAVRVVVVERRMRWRWMRRVIGIVIRVIIFCWLYNVSVQFSFIISFIGCSAVVLSSICWVSLMTVALALKNTNLDLNDRYECSRY